MNKYLKSLTLAFALASSAAVPAFAQQATYATPPPAVANEVAGTAATQAAPVLQMQDIQNAAYNIGVQAPYPLIGKAFGQGPVHGTDMVIGVQFELDGNQYRPAAVYNLQNGADANRFQADWNRAAVDEGYAASRMSAPVVYPQTYYIAPPVVEVVGFGFGIRGWHVGWVMAEPYAIWPGCYWQGGWGYNMGFVDGFRYGIGFGERGWVDRGWAGHRWGDGGWGDRGSHTTINNINNTYINNGARVGNGRNLGPNGGQRGFDHGGSFQGAFHGVNGRPATGVNDNHSFQGTFRGAELPRTTGAPQFNQRSSFPTASAAPVFRGAAAAPAAQPRFNGAAPTGRMAGPAAAPHAAPPAMRGGRR
jgi:hypothetical protein